MVGSAVCWAGDGWDQSEEPSRHEQRGRGTSGAGCAPSTSSCSFLALETCLEGPSGQGPFPGLLGLADPLHPEVPSGSGAGRAWGRLFAFPGCTPLPGKQVAGLDGCLGRGWPRSLLPLPVSPQLFFCLFVCWYWELNPGALTTEPHSLHLAEGFFLVYFRY